MLYDRLQFSTPSWVHRNRYYDKTAGVRYFNAELEPGSRGLICDISMREDALWRKTLLRKLRMNYGKAPFFDEVYGLVEPLILAPEQNLSCFNRNAISVICRFLNIETQIIHRPPFSAEVEARVLEAKDPILGKNAPALPEESQRRHLRLLALCSALDAAVYINPIGGTTLYRKDVFEAAGRELSFVQTRAYFYPQFKMDFCPHLSVLDLLFHLGQEGSVGLVKEYDLI